MKRLILIRIDGYFVNGGRIYVIINDNSFSFFLEFDEYIMCVSEYIVKFLVFFFFFAVNLIIFLIYIVLFFFIHIIVG